jgi:hypothetical protein
MSDADRPGVERRAARGRSLVRPIREHADDRRLPAHGRHGRPELGGAVVITREREDAEGGEEGSGG